MGMMDLVAKIRLDAGGIQRGVNEASSHIKKMGSDIRNTIIGAFGGAALVSAVRRTIQEIDNIRATSEEFNIPVEETQALEKSMYRAGRNAQTFKDILRQVQKLQLDIASGNQSGNKGLEVLQKNGYNRESIAGLTLMEFSKVLSQLSTQDLNSIGGSFAKLKSYSEALSNVEKTRIEGLKNGSIQTEEELEKLAAGIAESKDIIDTELKPILFALLDIFGKLAKGLGWLNNKINQLMGIDEESSRRRMIVALYKKNLEDRKTRGPIQGNVKEVIENFEKYGDIYSPDISPDSIYKMGNEQWMMGEVARKYDEYKKKQMEQKYGTANLPIISVNDGIKKVYSDSMLSVGNFLGQAGHGNMNIATSILDVNKSMNNKLEKIVENTDKIVEKQEFNPNKWQGIL